MKKLNFGEECLICLRQPHKIILFLFLSPIFLFCIFAILADSLGFKKEKRNEK